MSQQQRVQSMEVQKDIQTQSIGTQQPSQTKQGRQVVVVEGQLRKIIHQQGQGQCPKKGQQIYALYRGTLQSGQQFDSNQDRESPFTFNLGEGRVIKGWDEGFASMKRGEKATLICSPQYAYGKRGSPPKIPPNATLNFQVELIDFKDKKKEKWQLSDQQKTQQATKAKNQGNQAFKKGDYAQASRLYKQGLEFIDGQDSNQTSQISKVLKLNAAQAQIKTGQYSQAIKNCSKVLQKDPNNLKALYRRGSAHLKNQDFQKAQIDFDSLLKIQPSNTDAQKQLVNVKNADKAYRQKQKKVFGNMFSKAGGYSDQPKKQSVPKTEEQAPKTKESALKVEELAPKAEEQAPKAEESAPKAEEQAPKAEEQAPKAQE